MYSFHFHFLRVVSTIHIIILLDCLVIASKVPSHNNPILSRHNESEITNESQSHVLEVGRTKRHDEPTPTSHGGSSKDYWRQWLCTKSRKDFLHVFINLYKGNDLLCPNETYTGSSEDSPDSESNSVKRSKRHGHGSVTVTDKPPELTAETTHHHTDSNSNRSISKFTIDRFHDGILKKIRGCQWKNETHFCHQHILFRIDEQCFLHEGSSSPRIDEPDEIVDDLVKMIHDDKPALSSVWGYGIFCCTVVIFGARSGLFILPHLPHYLYEKLIITMVGLAAGTLTGSSIFHLLPKAFSLEEKFNGQMYLHRCLVIAGGLWTFLLIERLLKIAFHHNERKINNRRQRRVSNVLATPHKSEHNVVSVICRDKDSNSLDENPPIDFESKSETSSYYGTDKNEMASIGGSLRDSQYPLFSPSDKYRLKSNELPEMHTIKFQEGSLSLVSTEAWMIIVGDGFLDFVDGLSIGTAFQDSILTGFSISLGILLEELPHELGEFAVLLEAGLTFRKALVLKFLASCCTYLGLCFGVWLGGVHAGHYVFACAAGMFLYIALVDMVPELNEAAMKSTKTSVLKGLAVLVLQNVGLLLGMSVIYLMAVYEDVFKQL